MAEEKAKKRNYYRKPLTEITEQNYMEHSSKVLYKEIEHLRTELEKYKNSEEIGKLKAENGILKQKLTRINKISSKKEE